MGITDYPNSEDQNSQPLRATPSFIPRVAMSRPGVPTGSMPLQMPNLRTPSIRPVSLDALNADTQVQVADGQYTDAQLSDGRTLRFNGQLSPDEVKQKVAAFRSNDLTQQTKAAATAAGAPTGPAPLPKEFQPENPNARVDFDASGKRLTPHTNIIDQAAQTEADRSMRQSVTMNRAANSPTPMTNSVNVMNPVGAARAAVGAKVGGFAGSKLAPLVGASPVTGEVVGGLLGGAGSDIWPIKESGTIGDLFRMPATQKRAAGLFERGVAPGGMAAEDQALMRENFDRAAKYIAPQTRNGAEIQGGEGGAMRTAAVAHDAADTLWQKNVEPVVETFKGVQRPGDNIAHAIRGGFTDLDKATKPAAVNAGNDLANYFAGRPVSVGEMADYVRQLNNDRGVTRFYNMSPNEQVAAEMADPSLRSKVEALKALRGEMFDAIGQSGGEQLGEGFANARKDWGALRSIEDQVRQAKIPTPAPFLTKAGSTLRGAVSPHGADFWLRPQETLLGMNNPNRLLTKSFNTLGRTDLMPPTVQATPRSPFGLLPESTGPRGINDPSAGQAAGQMPGTSARPGVRIQPSEQPVGDAITLHPDVTTTGGFRNTGPKEQPIDVDNRSVPRNLEGVNVLPSSGRTIVTPRPGVEVTPGRPELNAGPRTAPQKQLTMPSVRGALPEVNPRNASGAIESGPSSEWGTPANARSRAIQEVENLHSLWSELPEPGRFRVHLDDRPGEAPTHKSTAVYGVTSPKPAVMDQFPWLKDLPMMTLSRVKQALEKGKGVDYDRVVKAAGDYLAKPKGQEMPAVSSRANVASQWSDFIKGSGK
jgi:hypothetical protein